METRIVPDGVSPVHGVKTSLELEAERARRYTAYLSVALINIDNFKTINDTLGVDGGNFVISEISSIIRSNIRKIDIFGRWDVDDFIILSVDKNRNGIITLAEKLKKVVSAKPAFYNGNEIKITLSIGVSRGIPKDVNDVNKLILMCKKALLRAKSAGRNRVEFYTEERDGYIVQSE